MGIKKIVFFIIIIVSLVIINSFIHSIYNLWQKNDLVVKAKQNLEREKEENKKLKTQLRQVKDPHFLEEEARNKLLLVKPGEQVIVLPENIEELNKKEEKKVSDTRPNWQKWFDIFF